MGTNGNGPEDEEEVWSDQSSVAALLLMLLADGTYQMGQLDCALAAADRVEAWRLVRIWQARCGRLDLWTLYWPLHHLGGALFDDKPIDVHLRELRVAWAQVDDCVGTAIRGSVVHDATFPDRFVRELPGQDTWRVTRRLFPHWRPSAVA